LYLYSEMLPTRPFSFQFWYDSIPLLDYALSS